MNVHSGSPLFVDGLVYDAARQYSELLLMLRFAASGSQSGSARPPVPRASRKETDQMGNRKPNLRSSIYYSEADGQWHGWATVGTKDDGSTDRRHRMGKSEAEATRKVRALEAKRDAGNAGKAGRPLTVADWFETWLTTSAGS